MREDVIKAIEQNKVIAIIRGIEPEKAGAVGVGVGSSLVNSKWVENGEFDKITETAKQLLAKVFQD